MSAVFRLTLVQSDLFWENPAANLKMFAEKLETVAGRTDLVVLPEMFTTGFSMNAPALAEEMDGKTIAWLRNQANRLDAAITGSFIVQQNGAFYNRLVWMHPGGQFLYYDKRHLFTLSGEHEVYTPGKDRPLFFWRGWKIRPLICYDLRFPVWSRNDDGYDLLLCVANWPERRSHHWRQLLIARAIENQSYVAGVNRTGVDGNGHQYTGDTALVDFAGNMLYQVCCVENISTVTLPLQGLQEYRSTLRFLDDRDAFNIL